MFTGGLSALNGVSHVISRTGTLHAKWHEACTGILGQAIRQPTKGAKAHALWPSGAGLCAHRERTDRVIIGNDNVWLKLQKSFQVAAERGSAMELVVWFFFWGFEQWCV